MDSRDDDVIDVISELRRLVAALPSAERYFHLGEACGKATQWEDAEASYLAALEMNPRHLDARKNLVAVMKRLSREESDVASHEIELFRHEQISMALRSIQEGDANAAVGVLNTLVDEGPYWEAYWLRGLVHYKNGDLWQAEWDFVEAIDLEPNFPAIRQALAEVFTLLGQNCSVILHQYQLALEISPNASDILSWYAVALARCRRLQESVAAATQAIACDSLNFFAFEVRANVLSALGKTNAAEYDLNHLFYTAPGWRHLEQCVANGAIMSVWGTTGLQGKKNLNPDAPEPIEEFTDQPLDWPSETAAQHLWKPTTAFAAFAGNTGLDDLLLGVRRGLGSLTLRINDFLSNLEPKHSSVKGVYIVIAHRQYGQGLVGCYIREHELGRFVAEIPSHLFAFLFTLNLMLDNHYPLASGYKRNVGRCDAYWKLHSGAATSPYWPTLDYSEMPPETSSYRAFRMHTMLTPRPLPALLGRSSDPAWVAFTLTEMLTGFAMYPEARVLRAKAVPELAAVFIALHELGHVFGKHEIVQGKYYTGSEALRKQYTWCSELFADDVAHQMLRTLVIGKDNRDKDLERIAAAIIQALLMVALQELQDEKDRYTNDYPPAAYRLWNLRQLFIGAETGDNFKWDLSSVEDAKLVRLIKAASDGSLEDSHFTDFPPIDHSAPGANAAAIWDATALDLMERVSALSVLLNAPELDEVCGERLFTPTDDTLGRWLDYQMQHRSQFSARCRDEGGVILNFDGK